MKLVRYTRDNITAMGVVKDDGIVDLKALIPGFDGGMIELLQSESTLAAINERLAAADITLSLKDVTLEAPLTNPRKFLAIGMNYQKHAEEAKAKGITPPEHQLWFNKQVSCITGPFNDVELPTVSEQLDYEVELAFVIGKRCRHVKVEDAADVIAAYTVCNDVSVRDWQLRVQTWTMGKSFDTHGPIGPWLVTKDEISDPHTLDLKCYVNGELRQSSNTSDLIHDCYQMVEHLSTVMTLEPGDIIATGTPSGVGVAMQPPQFLKVGDVVRCEVENIGYIENTIVAEG
ncbi:fumarylacetoacetate hydrolase family protein [Pseudomaricurvus alkylphenolicus]|uniref:fumarylacetoacetate hydrolase family protein n=1 Tax=Pseudomaricurvus alkylphenolicus TaxID=1306991 RepID=UPI00141FE9AF|nr:fumarylacetoacetate hydrolase family protein [Pseudomaricurvus alkylphenolicus]NIB38355.1 fumarylacetoacetate hydrolase family protein [Pseudomaricurvus alkylphenolicus]